MLSYQVHQKMSYNVFSLHIFHLHFIIIPISVNWFPVNPLQQSFHSQFTDASQRVGNLAIVPIRSKVRGPAPLDPSATFDIIDEALDLFKPLIFFRQFEFKVRHAVVDMYNLF